MNRTALSAGKGTLIIDAGHDKRETRYAKQLNEIGAAFESKRCVLQSLLRR